MTTPIPTLTTGNVLTAAEWNTLVPLNQQVGVYGATLPAVGTLPSNNAPAFLMQCAGNSQTTSGYNASVSFVNAFPNGVIGVWITPQSTVGGMSAVTWDFNVTAVTTGGFTLITSLNATLIGFFWWAIGF